MVKRRGDKTPDPPGGRAAERLRQYLESQRFVPEKDLKKEPRPPAEPDPPKGKQEGRRAKQDRCKD
jgi:hypothetical protein